MIQVANRVVHGLCISFEFRETIMGATSGDFVKYPRTPHLFGSRGTSDDKHLGERESVRFLADDSLIVEEKIDGTNVGIHFAGGEIFCSVGGILSAQACTRSTICSSSGRW